MPPSPPFGTTLQRPAPRQVEPAQGRSFDQQAMQRIDASRKRHAACRDIRVRALADEKRLAAEESNKMDEIRNTFGVDGVDALRVHCVSSRAAATAEIDAYVTRVDTVVDALVALGESI